METMLHNITANTDSFMFPMIFGVLGFVGLVAIVMATIWKISSTRQFEQSRREIAAHIAAGSMSPDDGARLLTAGADRVKGSNQKGMSEVCGHGSDTPIAAT
jgi:hypothetical protein